MAFRFDIGALQPAKRLPDGRVRADAYLTRAGVFIYRNADGTERREFRPESEVFKADSLDSFAQAPVTNNHPPEPVTSHNAKQYAVGATGDAVRRDGSRVRASIMVFDAETISQMEAGKVQLSCGYEVDLIETPGVTDDGERYDAVQTNIRGNHVALVEVGRAGPEVCVRMDAAMMLESAPKPETKKESRMDENEKKLLAALSQVAELQIQVTKEKSRADHLEAERDSLKTELSNEKKAREDAAVQTADAVRQRVELELKASPILGESVAKMSDREIKVAVIKKIDGVDLASEKKSDEYVNVRFDLAVERTDKSEQALSGIRVAAGSNREDAGDARKKARQAMIHYNQNSWQEPAKA